jgi:hypothetical protein
MYIIVNPVISGDFTTCCSYRYYTVCPLLPGLHGATPETCSRNWRARSAGRYSSTAGEARGNYLDDVMLECLPRDAFDFLLALGELNA